MRRSLKLVVGAVVVFAAAQLLRCERSNPVVTQDVAAPADVAPILRRACYDCHSNETTWPWYAHVAPVSWLLHRDVVDGRRHLNFSEWDKVPADRRGRKLQGVAREVASGDMPLWFYLPMHPAARLSSAEKARLQDWAKSAASLRDANSTPERATSR